ncbi:MAG: hypothetical protein ACRCS8_01165 [Brevinema sp.]
MERYMLRLHNLKDTDIISETAYNKSVELIHRLDQDDLLSSSETFTMMITHIAIAFQRVQNGEDIVKMRDDIVEEILSHPHITEAISLYEKNIDLLGELSDNEKPYLLANFIILFR